MNGKIYEKNRPKVYGNDRYAAMLCGALYTVTSKVWQDAEIFKAQLFACSATEDGYDLWSDYLSLTNKITTGGKFPSILEHLQSDCTFTKSSVDVRIKKVLGNILYTITEGVNTVSIVLPDSIEKAKVSALRLELEKIRPLHINVKVRTVSTSDEPVTFYISSKTGELMMSVPDNYYGEFDPSTMEGASIAFDVTNGNLMLETPDNYSGAVFSIRNGNLEVKY